MEFGKLLEVLKSADFYYTYLPPVLAVLISFFSLLFFVRFLSGHFRKFTRRTINKFDDIIADTLDGTNRFFFLAVSIYIGSYFIELSPEVKETGRKIIVTALIIQSVLWLGRISSRYLALNHHKWNITTTQSSFFVFFLRIILWCLAALLILENLGLRVTPLVAGLGIGGIAIALALQSVLGELIASLSIILDKPFVVGDFIVVDNFSGSVEKVGLKTTRIRSISGELLVFSNHHLISTTIKNYKNLPRRRSFFTLGVVYETETEKLKQIPLILKDIIDKHPKTEYDRVHFVAFADFSLNFEVSYYVLTGDYIEHLDTVQEINLEIISKFRQENIDFAYPTQTFFPGKQLEVAVKK